MFSNNIKYDFRSNGYIRILGNEILKSLFGKINSNLFITEL